MRLGRIDAETTANLGKIHGGRAGNIIPDEVVLHGEARSHDPKKLDAQCAHMRECFEEAGVRVGACHYHSSQPWPFPSSLMLGFTAEADDPSISVGRELSDARWFGVDELVDGLASKKLVLPPRLSVSHELIAHWLRESAGLELSQLLSDLPWQPARA